VAEASAGSSRGFRAFVHRAQRNSTAALHSAVLTSLCIAAVFIAVHRRNNLCAVHRRRISDLVIKNYFARISNIKQSNVVSFADIQTQLADMRPTPSPPIIEGVTQRLPPGPFLQTSAATASSRCATVARLGGP
jgi:hypothetical protein